MNDVTALVATIARDAYALECVRSLRSQYPDISIIVGDQNIPTDERWASFTDAGADKIIDLPHDCGVPYARNTMLKHTETDYILIGDDDFYYEEESNLYALRSIAELYDFVGGQLRLNGAIQQYQGYLSREGHSWVWTRMSMDNWSIHEGYRYKPCDVTFNFFIAHRRFEDSVLWDENITVSYEHSDFFLMARDAGLTTAFTPDSTVLHRPPHVVMSHDDHTEYLSYRLRRHDRRYFFSKWGVNQLVDFNGNVDTISDPTWELT